MEIWKFGPRPPENEFFGNFWFLWKGLWISLLTSPQPPPDIKFKSSYARKLDFSLLCPKMEIRAQAPKNGIFQKRSFFWKGLQISLPTSPQPPSDIKFKSSYARKRDFGLLCPNMEFLPQAPKNGIFQKNSFFWKASRFRFQRVLNHPHTLSLSQVMQENVLSKKLSLGLNFSTPSGEVTSHSLKGSMVHVMKYKVRSFLKIDNVLTMHIARE